MNKDYLDLVSNLISKGQYWFEILNENTKYKANIYIRSYDKTTYDYVDSDIYWLKIKETIEYDYIEALNSVINTIISTETKQESNINLLNTDVKRKLMTINKKILADYQVELLLQDQVANGYAKEVENNQMPNFTISVYVYSKKDIDKEDILFDYSVDTLHQVIDKLYLWLK